MGQDEIAQFAGLLSAAAAKYVFTWWIYRNTQQFRLVGRVADLIIYPVKSAKGVSVEAAQVSKLGLKSGDMMDRHWMVSKENGTFANIAEQPRLAAVNVTISDNHICLDAEGMDTLNLPITMTLSNDSKVLDLKMRDMETVGMDCGDAAAAWISKYLKKDGMRFVYSHPSLPKQEIRKKNTYYINRCRPSDKTAFADYSAVMLMTEPSLNNVNKALPDGKHVEVSWFRPNVVVSGCGEFAEDSWQKLRIGDNYFRQVKLCQRCIVVTVDPDTGIRDPDTEPLKTMRRYRQHPEYRDNPILGINLAIDKFGGTIKVGDPVYAVVSNTPLPKDT
ncbi:mitochondrial amidoxime reducing component 2 [Lingula anatina]|uniref:Mitochondrial amidoxime reducing component 2 n=1 Tax=Lingula anatina TaxID=7574 RepID=A0A1S3J2A0_LINAN|nr:mitochondrial amidoxime reducing component 2 [Lingula anatina]|eukprot:XP_013404530.1 mitochondrial amidoxime reducing component 2 [Lingula anatina]